jgi:hypothetical protein
MRIQLVFSFVYVFFLEIILCYKSYELNIIF